MQTEQTEAERRMNTSFGNANGDEVRVSDLGSGSDYTPFFQHVGVPSTDISSEGHYGVYHSVFDNYNWFIKFADPTFVYEQQQARVFGLEIIHMADTDVLPYDYQVYGKEIISYLDTAQRHAGTTKLSLNFAPALAAAHRFEAAGTVIRTRQLALRPHERPPDFLVISELATGFAHDHLGVTARRQHEHRVHAL